MTIKKRIGVKYCGGCNPYFDRTVAVDRIVAKWRDRVEFVSSAETDVDAWLVTAGCPSACVDLEPFKGRPIYIITDDKSADDFVPDF